MIFNEFNIKNRQTPIEIEKIAIGDGWNIYLDNNGNWKKNPIRIDQCKDSDWAYIDPIKEKNRHNTKKIKTYLDDWLDD